MNFFLLSCVLAFAAADVSHVVGQEERLANIRSQSLDTNPDGSYQWEFETENGINSKAQGQFIDPNAENPEPVVQGSAQWTAPDGQPIQFTYVADKDGYHPQSDFLPTPPPIPEAILRALKYIQDHPPQEERN